MSNTIGIKELSKRLDRSYITALRLVQTGKIQGIRKGGQWEVQLEEVERFELEGNRQKEEV